MPIFTEKTQSEALTEDLIRLSDAYAKATSKTLGTLGKYMGLGSDFFLYLKDPNRGFNVRTYDKAVRWFSAEWPKGVKWPGGVPRYRAETAKTEDTPLNIATE